MQPFDVRATITGTRVDPRAPAAIAEVLCVEALRHALDPKHLELRRGRGPERELTQHFTKRNLRRFGSCVPFLER